MGKEERKKNIEVMSYLLNGFYHDPPLLNANQKREILTTSFL